MIRAPVTMRTLSVPFHLYNVIKLPMTTPEKYDFFCRIAAKVKSVAFSRDADYFIQIDEGSDTPAGSVSQFGDAAVSFIDREWPTCARALIERNLLEIKEYCRYFLHKAPYPRGVIKLGPNTHLLTNISTLRMHCYGQSFIDNATDHTIHLTELQVVKTMNCHCDKMMADEFSITVDLEACNRSRDISSVINIKFPINVAYLTEYFTIDDLHGLTPDALLNDTVEVQLPKLAIMDHRLNEKFDREEAMSMDMEQVINTTKNSGTVYKSLAHYLFNEMVKAHDSSGNFDLLSVWTWLSIFGWCAFGAALVLVVMLRIKVRSLTLLLINNKN